MRTKFVVLQHENTELIFEFPEIIDHDRYLESLRGTKFGHGSGWGRAFVQARLLSAGFIESGVCTGRSETLNIGTRGAADSALLSTLASCEGRDAARFRTLRSLAKLSDVQLAEVLSAVAEALPELNFNKLTGNGLNRAVDAMAVVMSERPKKLKKVAA